MSKSRQQLKTGLRAILGGGLRDEPQVHDEPETPGVEEASAPDIEPTRIVVASVETPAPESKEYRATVHRPTAEAVAQDDAPVLVVLQDEPARKLRKKPVTPPPPEPKVKMVPAVRVGTLENPYVRKRDNLPTRKVGIVLPVALAERMQIHCVKARTRPNEFVARAIEALLDELQA